MNETTHYDRYPGARPFTDTEYDRRLFFGRDQELSDLLHQLLSVNLLVLFGKSGLGKTSLLQAGLFPRLRERDLLPLPMRLNRPELAPMTVFTEEIKKACAAEGIDYTPGETTGLWEFFKTAVFWRGDSLQTPVLVLDQFEEIFTLQSVDNRRLLARELGDLIGGRLPQRVRERLLAGEKLPYSDKPPVMKVILSLREDYLGALQELTADAPQILDNRFRLTPLGRAQARLAVMEPARLEASEFSTQTFVYDDSTVEEMLAFLGGKTGEIEPFQLQVLCRQVEQKVQQEQAQGKRDIRVDRAYLGGRKAMERILQNFYLDAIKRLPKRRLRSQARLLCEEGLLSPEGHRVSLVEKHIKKMYGLPPPALQILVDTRLLRKEERLESYYYELSHDSLTQPVLNSRRWRMPRGLKIGLGVAVPILLLSGGGFFWIWDTQVREFVEYYNTFAKRWGKPVGIGPLTLEQVKYRSVSLKLIRHGRPHPVESVMAVNGQGECTPNNNVGTYFKQSLDQIDPLRECQWEFVYDSQERVVYEKAYNKLNKMVWGFIYSPSTEDNKRRAHYVGPDGFPRPQLNSSAEFVEFIYSSPEGDEILRTYFDRHHKPQPGPDKAFGLRQEFYPNGLIRQITSLDLDPDGQPMIDTFGNAIVQYSYDGLGNAVEAVMLDANERPILVKEGWYRFTAKYDDRGNRIEGAYFDTASQPILHKDGNHLFKIKYDNHGNQIEQAYFGTAGQPILVKDGYHLSRAKYDDRGNQIEWELFDTTDQPTLHKDGFHLFKVKHDERGNQIEWAYFDTTGQPTLHKDGYYRSTAKYDERGNKIEWTYFDTAGQPILHKDGYHLITGKYDERGNQIEWAYFDTAGQPILHKDGYHLITGKYDERGNQIEWAYFDTAGQPILLKDNGYHRSTAKYDDRGNQIEATYFDTAGQPALVKDGFHKLKAEHDDRGNQIEWAYFDTAGQPILHKDGYHRSTAKYDDRGNKIEWAYFDTTGQPTLHKDGYHRSTAKYDERGNRIEWEYFDTHGEPTLDQSDGTHKMTAQYDERGNRIEQVYYGINGELIPSKEGFKKRVWRYYPNGQKAEEITIGLDGSMGFTKKITRYDEAGKEIYQGFFDDQDKPARTNHNFATPFGYSEQISEYLPSGKLTAIQLSGFEPHWGYARMVVSFDEEGNPLRSAYFDSNNQPVETEILVTEVVPDSRAEKMGIQAGDVFTHYDGKPTTDYIQFITQRAAELADGPPKELLVRRNGEILSFWLSPGKIGVTLQDRGITPAATHPAERK